MAKVTEVMQLVRSYGNWMSEAAFAERLDSCTRQKIAMNKAEQTLCRIESILKTLPLCTGVSAGWCPIHGDCTCVDPEYDKNDDTCPLHSGASNHGDVQE